MKSNFILCQCEKERGMSYDTYSFGYANKYGFVVVNSDFDFVSHVGCDNATALADLVNNDKDIDAILNLKVGETFVTGFDRWLRVW